MHFVWKGFPKEEWISTGTGNKYPTIPGVIVIPEDRRTDIAEAQKCGQFVVIGDNPAAVEAVKLTVKVKTKKRKKGKK